MNEHEFTDYMLDKRVELEEAGYETDMDYCDPFDTVARSLTYFHPETKDEGSIENPNVFSYPTPDTHERMWYE